MQRAIYTKYHGPGNVKGARYSATDIDGNRVYHNKTHCATPEIEHLYTAIKLCRKMGWQGTFYSAPHKDGGYVWVMVNYETAGQFMLSFDGDITTAEDWRK